MKAENIKALVTGGAGFIGSHMAEALLQNGARVTVLDDMSTGQESNVKILEQYDGFSMIKASVTDRDPVVSAVGNADVVFHFAAIVSVPYSIEAPENCFFVNIQGFENIIAALRDLRKPLFYASSAAVYGNNNKSSLCSENDLPSPESPYAASKAINEIQAIAAWNVWKIPTFGFRFFNVYGPRQNSAGGYASLFPNVFRLIRSGQNPVIYGDGSQSRDFIYVKDVANTLLAVFKKAEPTDGGQVFNLATGKSSSVIEIVNAIIAEAGVDVQIDFQPQRAGDIKHSRADIAKLSAFLGRMDCRDLAEGIKETQKWFMR